MMAYLVGWANPCSQDIDDQCFLDGQVVAVRATDSLDGIAPGRWTAPAQGGVWRWLGRSQASVGGGRSRSGRARWCWAQRCWRPDRPRRTPTGTPAAAGPLVIGHRGASGYRPEHVDGLFTDNPDVGVLARELA